MGLSLIHSNATYSVIEMIPYSLCPSFPALIISSCVHSIFHPSTHARTHPSNCASVIHRHIHLFMHVCTHPSMYPSSMRICTHHPSMHPSSMHASLNTGNNCLSPPCPVSGFLESRLPSFLQLVGRLKDQALDVTFTTRSRLRVQLGGTECA